MCYIKTKYIVLSGIALVALYGFTLVNTSNPEKDKLLIEIMAYVLERGHYDPETIDDSFSENVFSKSFLSFVSKFVIIKQGIVLFS